MHNQQRLGARRLLAGWPLPIEVEPATRPCGSVAPHARARPECDWWQRTMSASMLAPRSTSKRVILACPSRAAHISAVLSNCASQQRIGGAIRQDGIRFRTYAMPGYRRLVHRAQSSDCIACGRNAASLTSPTVSRFAPKSSSSVAAAMWPFRAAMQRAVWPSCVAARTGSKQRWRAGELQSQPVAAAGLPRARGLATPVPPCSHRQPRPALPPLGRMHIKSTIGTRSCPTNLVLGLQIGAMLRQQSHHLGVAAFCRQHDQRLAILRRHGRPQQQLCRWRTALRKALDVGVSRHNGGELQAQGSQQRTNVVGCTCRRSGFQRLPGLSHVSPRNSSRQCFPQSFGVPATRSHGFVCGAARVRVDPRIGWLPLPHDSATRDRHAATGLLLARGFVQPGWGGGTGTGPLSLCVASARGCQG